MPTLVTRKTGRPGLARTTKILIAVLLSVIIHGLLLLLLAWVLPHWPKGRLPPRAQPFRLTITKSTPAPNNEQQTGSARPTPPPYIATQDEQLSAKPPENPAFISDKDTLAASETPGTGDKPLPTQQGKEIPAFDFDTRPFRLDKVASSASSAAPAAPADTKPPSKDKQKSPKTTKSLPDSKSKPSAQPPPPSPSPTGELATLKLAAASPTPAVTPQETPDNSETPPPPESQPMTRQTLTSPATPNPVTSPGLPKRPGYQPQSIQTKMTGAISNRGRSAVAAIGTPMGRYQKVVSDAIGMRWYRYVQDRADLLTVGSVMIHFVVSSSGHVSGIRIVSGNPNAELATISIGAVAEAEIPPIPPDVAATLESHQLETEYSFSEY